MTRTEAFDKAWRLAFKGDFSLYDEIFHPEFKGVLAEVELNIEAFKEGGKEAEMKVRDELVKK